MEDIEERLKAIDARLASLEESVRSLADIFEAALLEEDPHLDPDTALGELLERKHAELAMRVKESRRGH